MGENRVEAPPPGGSGSDTIGASRNSVASTKPSIALAEAHQFLAAHPELKRIAMIFTDLSGVARGKLLTRDEVITAYSQGRFYPGSMTSVDVTGRDVEETGLVWDDGDADRICWPVAGTLAKVPWLADNQGQYIASLHEAGGEPSQADPRHTLARVIEICKAEHGFTPVAAIELEFYLMDREATHAGRPSPPRGLGGGAQCKNIDSYALHDLEEFAPFFRDLYDGAAIQGLPVEALISEYEPGQMEIGLRHRTDALKACDEAVMFKRLVKGTASKHGLVASFMAKPYRDHAGCGMHVHASLNGADGENAFSTDDPASHLLLRHAVAGLLATMPESLAIFAPNANSYRRFRKSSYAPTNLSWGINNRTVCVRIPAATGAATHIEHRLPGADANPYLALAAVLSGMCHGISQKLDPGPPIAGNAYAREDARLPLNWPAALQALRTGNILKDYMGARFLDIFATVKEAEADRFFAEPQQLDFEFYLRAV
jgi:glutamine synthetase